MQSSQSHTLQSAQSQSTNTIIMYHKHNAIQGMHKQKYECNMMFYIRCTPLSSSLVVFYMHDDMNHVLKLVDKYSMHFIILGALNAHLGDLPDP